MQRYVDDFVHRGLWELEIIQVKVVMSLCLLYSEGGRACLAHASDVGAQEEIVPRTAAALNQHLSVVWQARQHKPLEHDVLAVDFLRLAMGVVGDHLTDGRIAASAANLPNSAVLVCYVITLHLVRAFHRQ